MLKKSISLLLIITMLVSINLMALATDIAETESEKEIENKESVLIEFTLDKAIDTALQNNLQWQLANKQIELQNLQVTISDRLNNDLRKAERNLRDAGEMLSESILAIQHEISFIKSLTFPTGKIGDQWDILTNRQVSISFINNLIQQFGSEIAVKNYPTHNLIGAMELASQDSAEKFFEIKSGKTQTIRTANETAASLMGLKSVRKLTMKQALKIINTSIDNGSILLKKADEDAKRGIKLQAENAYYEVVKKQKLLQVQQKAEQRVSEQYKNALKSSKEGLLSKRELELAQIQLNNMKANLHNAEIGLKKAKLDFCVALGMPLNQEFIVTEPEWILTEISLEEGLEMAKTNRTDMVTAAQGLSLAELNLEYVDEKHKDSSNEFKESALYKDSKLLEYNQITLNAEVTITKSYMDWQNADYAYQQIQENLALVNNQLNIAQVSFDVGYSGKGESPLITLLEAGEQVAKLEQALTTAEFNRNLAWQKFLKEIGYVKEDLKEEEK
ncbi:TolC family protein [Clostridium sp. 'deep sea']|uniref:TolC family protein n=1 Tax=Clostridium sp. 'deep sea' TaxID=2779445 RepID=UPI00189673BB|nr:TolC family protein [Clostridium sp. 'deep sea']QOR34152.1 TolC family protein [Clostridium sp. 'deep sea']